MPMVPFEYGGVETDTDRDVLDDGGTDADDDADAGDPPRRDDLPIAEKAEEGVSRRVTASAAKARKKEIDLMVWCILTTGVVCDGGIFAFGYCWSL
mmetsp:Transcript_20423/g.48037  ORF Transcript_20423/g.48037 Transcript_20423/m.48037 type:complete len:96 (-) Transcript_20423:389-676(-)